MFIVTTQRTEVVRAIAVWRRTLERQGSWIRRIVTAPSGANEQRIIWLPQHHLWAGFYLPSDKKHYWCDYGFCEAEEPGKRLNITIEINPIFAANGMAKGRILKDGEGRLFLAHRGGKGGGRGRQLSPEQFFQRIRGIRVVEAEREGRGSERLFLFGDVDDPKTIGKVASYVRQAERLAVETAERAKMEELLDFAAGEGPPPNAPTQVKQLIEARLGQGKFRKDVLKRWGGRCAISGVGNSEVVRASHMRPWKKCVASQDKLDPQNGLPLTPNYDVLFDRGLISFTRNGKMVVSRTLTPSERTKLKLPAELRRPLMDRELAFMDYHRTHVFRG